jgi:hypothetical protein
VPIYQGGVKVALYDYRGKVDLTRIVGSGGGVVPVDPAADPSVVFFDDFTGAAGTVPDSVSWTPLTPNDVFLRQAPPQTGNVFQDGNGNLVLRVKREPGGVLDAGGVSHNFSGSIVGTFNYGSGWPPTAKKQTWTIPFAIEARILRPNHPNMWPALWMMGTNKTTAQGITEIDWAENKTTTPTAAVAFQHLWANGVDVRNQATSTQTVTDQGTNWHVWRVEVRQTGVSYYIDNTLLGTLGALVNGDLATAQNDAEFGLLINNTVESTFAPAVTAAGPWDLLVDYVKVTSLAPVTPPPATSSTVWQGARVQVETSGPYSTATGGGSPFDIGTNGVAAAGTATALYESHQAKGMACVHYGGSISAWPPLAFSAATANNLRAHGSFPYYGYATNGAAGGGQADILKAYTTLTDTASVAARDRARNNLGKLFQQIKDWGYPLMFRPWWENNGGWFSWGRSATGPAGEDWSALGPTASVTRDQNYVTLWRNTWQLCADVMTGTRNGVSSTTFGATGTPNWGTGTGTGNISFHWAPNNFGTPGSVPSPEPRFPGTQYVDWLGWQGYLMLNESYSLDQLFGPIYDLCKRLAPTKPMGIGEYGCANPVGYTGLAGVNGKVGWYKDFLETWLPSHPEIQLICYYNQEGFTGTKYQDLYIETPDVALTQWRTSLANARYLANVVGSTPYPMGQGTKVPRP